MNFFLNRIMNRIKGFNQVSRKKCDELKAKPSVYLIEPVDLSKNFIIAQCFNFCIHVNHPYILIRLDVDFLVVIRK